MKKLILASFFSFLSVGAFAQLEIGVKASPNLAWNRVEGTNNLKESKSEGSRLHLSGGLVIDKFFGDNYAFSTGLLLATKGGTIAITPAVPGPAIPVKPIDIMVQYVEVPVTLKLFTNEVAPDMRVYFQLGGGLGFLTGARIDDEKNVPTGNGTETEKASKRFNSIELSALLGAGIEYQLGESTKVFGGLGYQHGLTDIADDKLGGKDLTIKNSVLGLDLGIKF